MLSAELGHWRQYMTVRVERRGWNADMFVRGLSGIPRSVPQAHRWQLFRLHLNGHCTTARVFAAGVVDSVGLCCFCRAGPDSIAHLLSCTAVARALELIGLGGPGHEVAVGLPELFFQRLRMGAEVACSIAIFCAIWAVRGEYLACRDVPSTDGLLHLLLKVLQCPWVTSALKSSTRRERRQARVRTPSPCNADFVFRSDGASRRSQEGRLAGWGAARWNSEGALLEIARRFIGDATNNIAEYQGLSACMQRSLEVVTSGRRVLFEVDSLLIARQVQATGVGKFACRSLTLAPLLQECIDVGRALEGRAISWRVRHIYREYNQTADALANESIDVGSADWGPVPS